MERVYTMHPQATCKHNLKAWQCLVCVPIPDPVIGYDADDDPIHLSDMASR